MIIAEVFKKIPRILENDMNTGQLLQNIINFTISSPSLVNELVIYDILVAINKGE